MSWQVVIGLEIHVQLNTQSKLFSGSSTRYGGEPNTQADWIDCALPGTLPKLNQAVIPKAIKFGLATNSRINQYCEFARKNYFYPDLPKGYQTSQLDKPIVEDGFIRFCVDDANEKKVRIERAHLEEDAGKSLHEDFHGMSGIDLNRAGTPLIEIVTAPDIRSAKEAVACLKTIHTLVRYLDISDANMQEGSFRCDVNVSVMPSDSDTFGTRCEIKNLNSFKFVEEAIAVETERQIDLLESGHTIAQETRLYSPERKETKAMRSKADAHDYRYFVCPDLLPIIVSDEEIATLKAALPELPRAKRQRFVKDFALTDYDAQRLTETKPLADFFEDVVKASKANAKLVANWILGTLMSAANDENLDAYATPISAERLGLLLTRIEDNTLSGKIAKTVFAKMWESELSADEIIEQEGLKQITDTSAIEAIIDDIIKANPAQVEQYRSGKDKIFGFFVGQVMKATKGQAAPAQVNQLLKAKLSTS